MQCSTGSATARQLTTGDNRILFKHFLDPNKIQAALANLKKELESHAVKMTSENDRLTFTANNESITFFLAGETFDFTRVKNAPVIPLDYLLNGPKKITAIVLSKLSLNTKIFARLCEVKKTDKKTAEAFFETWHLMGATQSAYNLGLFYDSELVAAASFSKGRKMDRLPGDKRSFELIRFCCKSGITVTGGLTKLLKAFFIEKSAGDIMSYVDKQLSDGRSFISAGFKDYGETPPNYFLVNKATHERTLLKDEDLSFDKKQFYLAQNSGNIKLVYKPHEKL